MKALGVAAMVGAVVLGGAASGASAPTRFSAFVLDRTMLCEVGVSGGIREFAIKPISAIRKGPRKHGAAVDVVTTIRPTGWLARIAEGAVEVSPACPRSTASVPLTTRGLDGAEAGIFGSDEYDCGTPTRVLVRVRAVFTSRVALRRGELYGGIPLLFARGTVTEAQIAIRTRTGRRVAVATISKETGKARVFSGTSCVPD